MIQLELRLAINDLDVELARNDTLPQLDLDYSYTAAGQAGTTGRAFDNIFDRPAEDHSIGVSAVVPLGNRAAQAHLRQARLNGSAVKRTGRGLSNLCGRTFMRASTDCSRTGGESWWPNRARSPRIATIRSSSNSFSLASVQVPKYWTRPHVSAKPSCGGFARLSSTKSPRCGCSRYGHPARPRQYPTAARARRGQLTPHQYILSPSAADSSVSRLVRVAQLAPRRFLDQHQIGIALLLDLEIIAPACPIPLRHQLDGAPSSRPTTRNAHPRRPGSCRTMACGNRIPPRRPAPANRPGRVPVLAEIVDKDEPRRRLLDFVHVSEQRAAVVAATVGTPARSSHGCNCTSASPGFSHRTAIHLEILDILEELPPPDRLQLVFPRLVKRVVAERVGDPAARAFASPFGILPACSSQYIIHANARVFVLLRQTIRLPCSLARCKAGMRMAMRMAMMAMTTNSSMSVKPLQPVCSVHTGSVLPGHYIKNQRSKLEFCKMEVGLIIQGNRPWDFLESTRGSRILQAARVHVGRVRQGTLRSLSRVRRMHDSPRWLEKEK